MNVLVIGCGYVGGELAARLHAQGDRVWGLRRNTALLPKGVIPVACDVVTGAGLDALPQRLDACVYAVSPATHDERGYRDACVTGLARTLEHLRTLEQPPERFVLVGSTGVYDQNEGEWVDEASPPGRGDWKRDLLLEGEQRVREAYPAHGSVVRLAGIYGPGRTQLIDSVRNGTARLVEGRGQVLNHIHRDDAARAIGHVLGLSAPRPLYLGVDNEPAPKNEVLRWLAAELGLPMPEAVPATELNRPGRGGNRYYSNRVLRESGFSFLYPTYREGYRSLLGLQR